MFERIVVGAAETEGARAAVRTAGELAALCGAELHLALGFDDYKDRIDPQEMPETRRVSGYLDELAAKLSVSTHTHARAGDGADVILAVAEEVGADLIVVGSKGMQGAARILGSTPNSITHRASCSVLIVQTA